MPYHINKENINPTALASALTSCKRGAHPTLESAARHVSGELLAQRTAIEQALRYINSLVPGDIEECTKYQHQDSIQTE